MLTGARLARKADAASIPTLATVSGSAHEIEWPQIALGFGGGVLLAMSLFLAMRTTRPRLPAH